MPGNNPEEISIWQLDAALPLNFFWKFYFDLKMPKMVFKQGYLSISNQTKCPFTVLSALFLFFQMLCFDSRLFPSCIIGFFGLKYLAHLQNLGEKIHHTSRFFIFYIKQKINLIWPYYSFLNPFLELSTKCTS